MTAQNPLSYLNNEPSKYPATIFNAQRDPSTQDLQSAGTKWYSTVSTDLFFSKGGGVWVKLA